MAFHFSASATGSDRHSLLRQIDPYAARYEIKPQTPVKAAVTLIACQMLQNLLGSRDEITELKTRT